MFLSVDYGTSSLKVAIIDKDYNVLQTAKEDYPYIILPGEKVEIEPSVLLAALPKACGRLDASLLEKVDILCYDTFSPSLMLMDADGGALYPVVTHMDRRSRKQSAYIQEVMGKERFQAITGVYPFTGGTSVLGLLWFMQNEPGLCKKIYRIGHLPTFLHKHFTGEWAVDLVNASMMGLYDTVGQTGWSDEMLKTFSIPGEWLGPIVTPGIVTGSLRDDVASALGLRPGIPVAMGTNDAMASQAGAGNDRAGQALNIAGSSDMVSILTDRPALNPGYYVRNAAKKGMWQIYATTSGGFAIDWFREQFCRELTEQQFFSEFLPASVNLWRDNSITFDPYLSEDRQSLELKRAAWHGLTLGATREAMLAALLSAMQEVLLNVVNTAAAQIAMDKSVKVTGGFASDPIFALKQQMFGGYTLVRVAEGTLKGNAVLAAGISK